MNLVRTFLKRKNQKPYSLKQLHKFNNNKSHKILMNMRTLIYHIESKTYTNR